MALPSVNNLNGILVSNIGLGDLASPTDPLMVSVNTTIGWPEKGIFSVNNEIFYYDQSLGGTSTSFAIIYRSFDYSALQSHTSGTLIQQRIIAQHHEETLNLRRAQIVPGVDDGQTILRVPGCLIIDGVEIVVLQCFDPDIKVMITAETDSGVVSPVSPTSPITSPIMSPSCLNPETPITTLIDYDESELDMIARWDKATQHSYGNWQSEHQIIVYWLGGIPSVGKADVIIHTSARREQ